MKLKKMFRMKLKSFLIILSFIQIICGNVEGQAAYVQMDKKLERLFNNIALSEKDSEKKLLNDSIIVVVDQYVNTDSVFNHRFSDLRYLGQIMSPDSLLKIITWNVPFTEGAHNYYCYILKRTTENTQPQLYKFTAASGANKIRTDTIYSQGDWYGALYYDVRPYTINNENVYLLLGMDFKDFFLTRKVIEVLTFTGNGKPVLGSQIFRKDGKLDFREVFEYSSKASMTLRFDSSNEVVFDHLSPFSPEYEGNFQYYGPDFSYDSFLLENGKWILKQDIDVRNK